MKKIIILVLSLLVLGMTSTAQVPLERSQCIISVMNLLDNYEYYSTLDDEDMVEGFKSLFTNTDVKIYNDLIGLSDASTLTVADYVKIRSERSKLPRVLLKNITLDLVESQGNHDWIARVSFDKEQSYTDNCGIMFSSHEFFSSDYRLTAMIKYNAYENVCKIENLAGEEAKRNPLPKSWCVIQKTDSRDEYATYNKKMLKFNSYEQSFIDDNFDKRKLKFKDADVVAKPIFDPECKKLVTIAYKARRFRVKLHDDITVMGGMKVNVPSGITFDNGTPNNVGIDFGYIFPTRSIVKPGVFFGVGFFSQTNKFMLENKDYFYTTSADVDGDSYIRHYANLSLKQTMRLRSINIPVYFDCEFHLGRIASLYVDLGAKLHLNVTRSVSLDEGSAYIWGQYPKYDNLLLDEHWGYNGFGQHKFSGNELTAEEIPNSHLFTADILTAGGVRINIPSTPIALDFGVGYTFGFMKCIDLSIPNISSTSGLEATSPVYNTISGTTSFEHVRPLTQSLGDTKFNNLTVNLGLIFKI